MKRKRSLLESVGFLVIVGIVAGAIGGLAIGVVTGRAPSSSTSTAK
jgi:hypothetical protein